MSQTRRPQASLRAVPGLPAQLLLFACVGLASTVAYAFLYLILRDARMTAQAANAISLIPTALANTAANRRITFGIRGIANAGRHQVQGLVAFGVGLVVTSAALAGLHAASPRPARVVEIAVVVTATVLATALRFVLYRWWVFRPARPRELPAAAPVREGGQGNPPLPPAAPQHETEAKASRG